VNLKIFNDTISKQQGAARRSKEQKGAGKQQASSKQAATSVCPLERMIKYKLQNSIQYKNCFFSRRTAPKQ